jgi:hypothetical protein
MTKKISKINDNNPSIQKAQRKASRISSKKPRSRHLIFKLQIIKDKRKILKKVGD